MRRFGPVLLGVFALFGLWAGAHALWGSFLVPGPVEVLTLAGGLVHSPGFWADWGLSVGRSLAGFALAWVAGTALGFLMGQRPLWGRGLFVPVAVLQGGPPLLWIVPLVLLLGTRGPAAVAVVFLVVLPVILINVQQAQSTWTRERRDVFSLYAPSLWLRLREGHLPLLRPAFHANLLIGLVLALKSSVTGEWFGAQDGLGRRMQETFTVFALDRFAALALLFLLTVILLGWLAKRLADRAFPSRQGLAAGPLAPAPASSAAAGPSPASAPAAVPSSAPAGGPSPAPGDAPGENPGGASEGPLGGTPEDTPGARTEGLPGAGLPPPPPPGALKLTALNFAFSGRRPLFKDLNLSLGPGQTLVLVGASGLGKTTLARLALGLIPGVSAPEVRPLRPACLFQDDGLLPHRDALGNVALPLWNDRDPAWRAKAAACLRLVGLEEAADLFPEELSGGMKKRLAFARALARNPDFMILDEPFANLHRAAREELWALYRRLFPARGLASLIITHHPEELTWPGLRRAELKDGALQEV